MVTEEKRERPGLCFGGDIGRLCCWAVCIEGRQRSKAELTAFQLEHWAVWGMWGWSTAEALRRVPGGTAADLEEADWRDSQWR